MLRQGCATVSAVLLCMLLSACGGGGAAGGSTPIGNVGSTTTSSTTTSTASIQFAIAVPGTATSTQSGSRQLKYISAATKSATISIVNAGGTASSPTIVNCLTTCAANMTAPLGNDTFSVSLYDGTNGSGNLLSSGTATATIVPGQSNAVNVSFGGAVARIALSATTTSLTIGSSATIPLTVTAYDASGHIIVGNQPFLTPLVLSDSDGSGATSLSQTTITNPSTSTALTYNGGALTTSPTISIAYSGGATVSSNTLSFSTTATTPAPTVTPTIAPVANGSVPAHMMVYAVLPGNYANPQGNASSAAQQSTFQTMAQYVNYVETDNRASSYVHNAGMKTGFYTDPIQAHGSYELSWPEAAFAHDCNGNRVVPNYTPALENEGDPNSPTLAASWDTEIQTHLHDQWGSYPQDFVRADDSSYPGQTWQTFYAAVFGGATEPMGIPYCNYTNANFLSGIQSLYGQAPVPVIFNGATDPSYTAYVANSPNIIGGQCESCFGGWTGTTWQNHVNTEIAYVGMHKIFHSFSHGNGSAAQQLYLYASMLLGFDPSYTMLSMDISTPSGISTTPLVTLVPMQPTQTASTVAGYLQPEGVYVRQFGACYISQMPVGQCAVVVNSDVATHNFPAALANYHHTVSFSGSGIVHAFGDTGTVSTNGAAPPSTLASMTATIVFP